MQLPGAKNPTVIMRKKLTVLVNQLTPISYMKSEKPSLVSSWYWPSMCSGSWAAAAREGRSRSSMLGSKLWLKVRESWLGRYRGRYQRAGSVGRCRCHRQRNQFEIILFFSKCN